ncbi:MAG: nucleolar RNA-binding Nop10p family protein [Minisyncoccales bacterium]
MKLRKCEVCDIYTLEEKCQKCGNQTIDAHYKFIKNNLKNSIEDSDEE